MICISDETNQSKSFKLVLTKLWIQLYSFEDICDLVIFAHGEALGDIY